MNQKPMNVEFVRAGAGSGKTYHLTHLLADRLQSGEARPAAIVATTFTVKAATELRERARLTLLKRRQVGLAAAMGQASIGTVNSVCGQLVQRFCFELGISPDQTVLTEAEGRRLVKVAVDSVQESDTAAVLGQTAFRLGLDDEEVAATVHAIMDAARSNNIGPEDLAAMGSRNADAMLACWPSPQGNYDVALAEALERAEVKLKEVQATGTKLKVLSDAIDTIALARSRLARNQLAWSNWHQLSQLGAGAKQSALVADVQDIAARHPSHERFHQDVRSYLQMVFDVAGRALDAFAAAKQDLGVVDFTDQEVLLLRALRTSELVRETLEEELDLVLVDEFQDTSPLQLAIFAELAKLAKSSIWVGDPKQAIYGFRGIDSTLIQQILSSVESWGGKMGNSLSKSYRSTPALVGLVNEVFVPAFHPTPSEDIVLEPVRPSLAGQPHLLNWSFMMAPRDPAIPLGALGPAVSELLARGVQIIDKETGLSRGLQASDIAVLCRKNTHIKAAVVALNRSNIPAAAARPGLMETPEVQLVLACLRRMQDMSDTVATAMIVGLTSSIKPEEWLQDRLQFLADLPNEQDDPAWMTPSAWKAVGKDAHPLIARLEGVRQRLKSLTPREALRLAKSESGVARLAYQWSFQEREAQVRIANVEALLALAQQYEETCQSARQPATVNGLLLWLRDLAEEGGDGRAAGAHGAVEVMTFHAAKGLEWPVVIVIGVDHGYRTDLWGVRGRTEGVFDTSAPLSNRFIHHWVHPFNSDVQVIVDAEASPTGKYMADKAREENARLLYVTLTRARDVVALVGGTKKTDQSPACDWLDEVNATTKLWGTAGNREMGGQTVVCEAKVWERELPEVAPGTNSDVMRFFEKREAQAFNPLWFAPSSAEGRKYQVLKIEDVGKRIAVKSYADMTALGLALHGCIACAVADAERAISDEMIKEILVRWGVNDAVAVEAVRYQIDAFLAWWQTKWPMGIAQSELPIQVRRDDGSVVRGQVDMLISIGTGRILIDHKADPRGIGDGARLAETHGAQLDAYASAIESVSGEPVHERWLFLPVAASALQISTAP